ncbi:hypothetical protein ACWDRB_47210 [Nonomuraea sp. NPDC003707]
MPKHRRVIDAEDLAEDLQIAIATGELSPLAATLLITALSPRYSRDEATALLNSKHPTRQGNAWERLPNGDMRPKWGVGRRIWERTNGTEKGAPMLPELAERYGKRSLFYALATRR